MEWYWFVALVVGFWFSGYCIGRAHAKDDLAHMSKLLRDLTELVGRVASGVPDPPAGPEGSLWRLDNSGWTRVE